MEQVLELKNIYYAYHTLEGETPALTDISFTMNRGDFIAIVGPSGCGKSTLLSLISGLIKPEQGFIKINGKHLRESTTNVGYMLQHDELFGAPFITMYSSDWKSSICSLHRHAPEHMIFLTSTGSVDSRLLTLRNYPAVCANVLHSYARL